MRQVVREIELMRLAYGLAPMARNADGTIYFPRQVKGKDGLQFQRPSDPNLQRIFDVARDGVAAGVEYANDLFIRTQ